MRVRTIAVIGVGLALLAAAACGGHTSTPARTGASDAAAIDDAGADDATAETNDGGAEGGEAGPCDLGKPFGAPTSLTPSLSTYAHGSLTSDELLLFADYFQQSDLQSSAGITAWDRPDASAPFASGGAVPPCMGCGEPAVAGDGLMLVFTAGNHLSIATRASRSLAWGAATILPNVNSTTNDRGASLRADGQVLYFVSDRGGPSNVYDLYRSSMVNGEFTTPVPVTELNTPGWEGHAVVTADELTIYWESNRTDGPIMGGTDIWMATRATAAAPFGSVRNVTELNTTNDDHVDWITPDGCRIYFHGGNAPGLRFADRPSTSSGVTGRTQH